MTDAQNKTVESGIVNKEWRETWARDAHEDPMSVPLDELNPAHAGYFEANTMLPFFARLRREDPVHYCGDSEFGPYWSITKYEDVKHVDTHHELFSSDIDNGGIRLGLPMPNRGDQASMSYLPMFIMQDPPVHTRQRKDLAPKFAPTALAGWGKLIRERAIAILDGLPVGETFNWVREVSVELTGQMLATLFDVPQEDRHKLIHWSDTVERIGNPDYFETPEDGFRELWKCFDYFQGIWKARAEAAEPGDDLISFLAHGESTRNMAPNEFLGNVILLIVGGNDTTRNSISGGVLALNRFGQEFAKVKQDQRLIEPMVSEIIRWQSPVAHMCRTAMQDTEIRGQKIAKWDKVCIWYLSGNRDEEVFPDGDRFMIGRENARQQMGFGFGIHRCIGYRLAELQLKILWEEILARFSDVEVVGEPKYLNSSFIRGITELPVRVRAR